MKHYAIGAGNGFLGVYTGRTVEEAVFEFLDEQGINGFYYEPETCCIDCYFKFSSKRLDEMSPCVMEDFMKYVRLIEELFKNSIEISEGFSVYWKQDEDAKILKDTDKESIADALSEGFELFE